MTLNFCCSCLHPLNTIYPLCSISRLSISSPSSVIVYMQGGGVGLGMYLLSCPCHNQGRWCPGLGAKKTNILSWNVFKVSRWQHQNWILSLIPRNLIDASVASHPDPNLAPSLWFRNTAGLHREELKYPDVIMNLRALDRLPAIRGWGPRQGNL